MNCDSSRFNVNIMQWMWLENKKEAIYDLIHDVFDNGIGVVQFSASLHISHWILAFDKIEKKCNVIIKSWADEMWNLITGMRYGKSQWKITIGRNPKCTAFSIVWNDEMAKNQIQREKSYRISASWFLFMVFSLTLLFFAALPDNYKLWQAFFTLFRMNSSRHRLISIQFIESNTHWMAKLSQMSISCSQPTKPNRTHFLWPDRNHLRFCDLGWNKQKHTAV